MARTGFPKAARPVIEAVSARDGFRAGIASLAESAGLDEAETRSRVQQCLGEIVAIPSARFRNFAGRISKAIVSLGYESPVICAPEQLASLRELMRHHPVALLWTHKSHVDGAAVIATLHENGFPMLHSFGGANMAFAGVGYGGRRSGIIFIRRSFADDACYKFALRQYLGYLMEQRSPFSWAFEGTRSRVGKLMPPRLGLLKYLVEAAAATGTQGLRLVPVSLSYDLISDVDDYAAEESGTKKTKENLGWFLSYLKRLRSPMGRIYMNFGDPVPVDAPQALRNEDNDLYRLAFRVAVNVNRVTPVTMPALVCLVLLGALPRTLSAQQLSDRVLALVAWARERGIALTSSYSASDREQLDSVMEMMIHRGLITRSDRGLETVLGLGEQKHNVVGYYRNTAVHFFVNKAIVELALMRVAVSRREDKQSLLYEEARWIRQLLKHEFYFLPTEEFEQEIKTELDSVDPAWEVAVSRGVDSPVPRILASTGPLVAHATLLDILDAYLIMAQLLEKGGVNDGKSKSEWVAMGLQYGRQAYLQRLITSDASIGRQVLDNAYRWLEGEGLAPPNAENLQQLGKVRQRLERIVRRAELLRSFTAL